MKSLHLLSFIFKFTIFLSQHVMSSPEYLQHTFTYITDIKINCRSHLTITSNYDIMQLGYQKIFSFTSSLC